MIKLKDILSETKVGYLVEAKKKKSAKKPEKTGNPVLDKTYTLISKASGKEIPKTGKQISDIGKKSGNRYTNYPKIIKQIQKGLEKQETDTAKKKSGEETLNKIKNTNVKALDKKTGKKIDVKVDKVLKPPFGSAKEIDDNVPGTKEAKKVVYDAKVAEAQEKAKKEVETRKKKSKGKFKLNSEEKKEFNAWKEENPFVDNISEEKWLTEQKPREEMDVFNPEDGEQWEEDPFAGFDDGGEFDSDFDENDKYGQPVADKLGGDTQVDAMSVKLKVEKEDLIEAKKDVVITNKHGQPVGVVIFRNQKDGKYYAVDDEGVVYKSKPGKVDLDNPEGQFESEFDLAGFPGAQTSTGVSRAEDRTPDEWDDMGDSMSFEDLLDMLGLEDV